MRGEIERSIAAYLEDEKHLHRLRAKLLNLDGYQRQSEMAEKWAEHQRQHEAEIAALQQRQEEEIQRLTKAHAAKMREMQDAYAAERQVLQEEAAAKLVHLQQEFTDYRSEVDKERQRAAQDEAALAQWQRGYGALAAAYETFTALPERQRKGLAGIFGGCTSPLDFLCGAVQKGHLEQLWDYVRDELDAGTMAAEDAAHLSAIFDFSFAAVNASQREASFQRLQTAIGAAFDGDTMGRAQQSPQLGHVSSVLFAGFAHTITGRVARRSLVRLE